MKKLQLNKEVIARLGNPEMNRFRGGNDTFWHPCESMECDDPSVVPEWCGGGTGNCLTKEPTCKNGCTGGGFSIDEPIPTDEQDELTCDTLATGLFCMGTTIKPAC